ncbi:MAG: hypothetical protein ACPG77_07860 [Nannocystaceae bacterium]
MMSHRNRARGICCLLAASILTPFPTAVLAHPGVDPRAIELFKKASRELDQENFEAAVVLAERVLQLTDPIRHQDQRGTLIQLIINASFAGHKQTGRDADLCHLGRVLDAYASEIRARRLNTRDKVVEAKRVLGLLAKYQERVRQLVDDGCPSADTKAERTSDEFPPPNKHRPHLASAARRTTSTEESAQGVNSKARVGARRQAAAGASLVGMSGVFLGGVGLALWQFKINARAIEEIVETLQAEGRPATESELATSEASLANAVTARRLAIGMGVTAGLMMLVGVPALAVGLHRRNKGPRVVPDVAARHTGITVVGRFPGDLLANQSTWARRSSTASRTTRPSESVGHRSFFRESLQAPSVGPEVCSSLRESVRGLPT